MANRVVAQPSGPPAEIRRRVRRLLLNLGPWGDRVYTNPLEPFQHNSAGGEFPALGIWTRNEEAKVAVDSPREYELKLELGVEVIVQRGGAGAGQAGAGGSLNPSESDDVDDLRLKVLLLVGRDPTLGGIAADVLYVGCEFAEDPKLESQLASALLKFQVKYFVEVPEAAAADLLDLERVHAEWKLGDTATPKQASDDFTVATD